MLCKTFSNVEFMWKLLILQAERKNDQLQCVDKMFEGAQVIK